MPLLKWVWKTTEEKNNNDNSLVSDVDKLLTCKDDSSKSLPWKYTETSSARNTDGSFTTAISNLFSSP